MDDEVTPTQKTRRVGGASCVDASQSGRTPESVPMTPQSQVITRSRKRGRSPSLSDFQQPKKDSKTRVLERLPSSVLLLSLPKLLAVPPNHKAHVTSYMLSLNALRICSAEQNLPPDVECRAWTSLAEVGLRIVRAGWSQDEEQSWATGIENEVANAIGKGILIAQKTPSLVVYKQALSLLQARLEHLQHNPKRSRLTLKRLSSSFTIPSSSDTFAVAGAPSWFMYTTLLTIISHALSTTPPDLQLAFSTLQELLSTSEKLNDPPVKLLTHVLQLRAFVDAGMWDKVGASLMVAESALGLTFVISDSQTSPTPKRKQKMKEEEFISFDDPFETAMAIHVLILGVIYYTHTGSSKCSSPRLSHLHSLLDSDALSKFRKGVVDIKLSSGPPLTIKCTHPRVLFHLAYLVSCIAKRDVAGRMPKRKLFSLEGVKIWDKEFNKEIDLLPWADPRDAEEIDERMVKMKADLLSEVVGACIMRSEFEEADEMLSDLIAHTRTYDLFDVYSARITLHHAHLAHALGDASRASHCYAVAAQLAEDGTFVNVSARAGALALRFAQGECARTDVRWEKEVRKVVESCRGMGGTLESLGYLLQACASSEILSAKQNLKVAVELAKRANDSYAIALIFALTASLYVRTAEEHARVMLETVGQIAAGLGAQPRSKEKEKPVSKKGKTKESSNMPDVLVGNATLSLWVGEQFLNIYRLEGNTSKAKKQEEMNTRLSNAVQQLSERRKTIFLDA